MNPQPTPEGKTKVTDITFTSLQAPGDALMLTGAIRDLKRFYPKINVYVQSREPALFENNPHCTILDAMAQPIGVRIPFDYRPELQASPFDSRHFLSAMYSILERTFKTRVPMTEFKPELYLTDEEKAYKPTDKPYWVIVCGGKTDFTTKWWNPDHAQKVVDSLKDQYEFVQIGGVSTDPGAYPQHVHFPLNGVINLIGKTTTRQLISIIYNSEGVICPITFPMHAAAAVPKRNPGDRLKPCIVIAGGREPPQWEAYPGHRYLHTIGELPCCAAGACWARRAQLVKDGQPWNQEQLCARPVQVNNDLRIAECMHIITPEEVVHHVKRYMQNYPLNVLNFSQPIELEAKPMKVRTGTWDQAIANGVLNGGDYRIKPGKDVPVVIDIGAHIGSFAHYIQRFNPDTLIAVEAHPDNYVLAKENMEKINIRHKEVLNKAIWRSDKPATTVHMPKLENENTGGYAVLTEPSQYAVGTISLDEVIDKALAASGKDKVDVIKIDCEGSEFPALMTCTKLDKVQTILGEIHDAPNKGSHFGMTDMGPHNKETLVKFLTSQGFAVTVSSTASSALHIFEAHR